MNDDIGARIAQQAANGVGLHQVIVGAAGHEHVLCSVLAQFVDDEGTQETCAVLAHDADAAAVPEVVAVVPITEVTLVIAHCLSLRVGKESSSRVTCGEWQRISYPTT